MNFSLYFDKGTLLLFGPKEIILSNFDDFAWDDRTQCHRAPALKYRYLITKMREKKNSF